MSTRCERCQYPADHIKELITTDGETLCCDCWEKEHREHIYEIVDIGVSDMFSPCKDDHIGSRGRLHQPENTNDPDYLCVISLTFTKKKTPSLPNHLCYARVKVTRIVEEKRLQYRENTLDGRITCDDNWGNGLSLL